MRLIRPAIIVLVAVCGGAVMAEAAVLKDGQGAAKGKPQDAADPPGWTAQKCTFYGKAWRDLLELSGRQGISEDFIARNEAFIRSDCTDRSDICPASKEEGALVNRLTMATMNFGTASTFVPFVCRGTTGPLKMQ
ncbi:MAG: hypothetical protein PW791_05965 [Neorhizobium sp.]|nr:hypothetical protein [Neorhizobium sp.]